MLRLAVARRAGDLDAATASMARVEKLLELMPADNLARHAEIQASVLSARGVVQFWSGHLDEATASLEAGAAAAAASGSPRERNDGHGYLALLEAMRGRLSRAAELAAEAAGPADPGLAGPACGAAEVALALCPPGAQRTARHARPAEAGRCRPANPAGKAGRRHGLPGGGALPPGRRPRQGGSGDDQPRPARLVAPQLARSPAEFARIAGLRCRRGRLVRRRRGQASRSGSLARCDRRAGARVAGWRR